MTMSYNKTTPNFRMNGNWAEQSKALQLKYPLLTNEDLKFDFGKEDELIRKMSEKLGKPREEIIWIIKNEQPEKL